MKQATPETPRLFHWRCRKCGMRWRVRIPAMPGAPQRPDERDDTICEDCAERIVRKQPFPSLHDRPEVELS